MWLGAFIWVWSQPNQFPELTQIIHAALPDNPDWWEFIDPSEPHFAARLQEVIIFMIVAVILAVSGWRAKRLLLNHAEIERERANLARYFSPNVVEELSKNDDPLKQIRTQDIAVLFVDIVGFTTYAENKEPSEVIQTLREFHGLMEKEVFRYSGTLDKYLGDGLMATFGTPTPSDSDASNALKCARRDDRCRGYLEQKASNPGRNTIAGWIWRSLRPGCSGRYWCQSAGICSHRQHHQYCQPFGSPYPGIRCLLGCQRVFGKPSRI